MSTDTHIYSIDTFSGDRRTVPGPQELSEDDALAYLAQRMADQDRGGLSPAYWLRRARTVLEDAARGPGVACIHRVARGRGVIVTAVAVDSAAAFEVHLFPLFDDDGEAGEICAAFAHPRLAEALREAGIRAEAWVRIDAAAVVAEQERGALVGFEAEITARLMAPLLPATAAGSAEASREASHAPLRGCAGGRDRAAPGAPAA
jgi:hypothetical protein